MPRYVVTGVPPEAADGATAFTPHLTRQASSADAYKPVAGYPGTRPIAMQFLDSTAPSPDLGDLAQMGTARTSDAPPAIWPNLYWTVPLPDYYPGAGMPVQIYDPTRPQDTTMIPVPAEDLRQTYLQQSALLAMGVRSDRRGQLQAKARQLIRWPRNTKGNGIPVG